MTEPLYLLDTNILLALLRGNELGRRIESRFGLTQAKQKPLISVVTCGEIRVLAARNEWGTAKTNALESALANLVVIDLNHPVILEAYVRLDLLSLRNPSGIRQMGKNDLWIAACSVAAGATLLTTDRDFEHLTPRYLNCEILPRS